MADIDAWALPTTPTPQVQGPAPDPSVDKWALPASTAAQVRNSLTVALPSNPDQEAQLRRAASATGVPMQTARNLPDQVKTQAAVASVDAQGLATKFPNLAQFLTNPDNARLAHDDIPTSAAVEQHAQALGSPGANIGPDTTPPTYRDRLTSWFRDLVGAEPAGRDEGAAARAFLDLEAKRQGVSRNDLREAIGGTSPIPQQFASGFMSSFTAGIAPDSGAPDTTGGQVASGAGTLAGFLVGAPLKLAAGAVEKLAGPVLERTVGESFVKGLSKDVGRQAATLGLASGATAAGQALDTGTPGSAAATIGKATASGAGMGAAFGAAGRLFPDNTLAQMGARILATNAALDTMSGQRPWDDRPLAQKVFDYGLNTFFSLNGAGRTAGGWLHDAARADVAVQDANVLGGLAQASAVSKLRERAPDLFKQFVEASNDGSVYVDGRVLAEALHQSGIGTDEMQAKLPDLQGKLEEALATGGQVKIPVADFATHIAGGPLEGPLLPHLRTDPEGMSQTEAEAFYKTHTDELKVEAEKITAQKQADEPFVQSQKDVQDKVLAQLDATGRFRPEVNASYAALTRDFYTTQAQRLGVLPHELFAQHPVDFNAESLAGDSLAQGERGLYHPDTGTISLLKGADLSTALHELGHHFFETLGNIAGRHDAPEPIKADMQTMLKAAGHEGDIADWLAQPLDVRRAGHETVARSFERYLLEGKAPTFEQRSLFSRFRSWLLNVYKSLSALKVDLTPEVRGVFDRMLASDDAIHQAEQARAFFPMFDSPEKGDMTPEEWTAYQSLGAEATDKALTDLTAKTVKDMAWSDRARSAALKDLAKDANEKRRAIRIEVRSEVMRQPVYKAWQFLTMRGEKDTEAKASGVAKSNGVDPENDTLLEAIAKYGGLNRDEVSRKWGVDQAENARAAGKSVFKKDGLSIEQMVERLGQDKYLTSDEHNELEEKVHAEISGQPQYSFFGARKQAMDRGGVSDFIGPNELHGKLKTEALREMYGTGQDAIWRKLSDLRMTSDSRGVHPDAVADLFGYASGKDLVQAIAEAEKPNRVIGQLTEQRMLEKHGEVATPEALARAADEAVHNDVRARFVATELKALNKSLGPVKDLAKAAKEVAESAIGAKRVRDISDRPYLAGETKASKEAEKRLSAGDTAGAAVAKRDQLLNLSLARAAREAQKAVDKGLTYLKRFDKDSIRKNVDVDIRDQIDSLLERFDLRQVPPEGPTRAQKSLELWLEGQRAAGYSPAVPPDLVDPAVRQHFKDMPVERFTGLVDSVKALEHIGKERKALLIAGVKHDLDEYVNTRLVPKMQEKGERFTKDELLERPQDRHTNEVAIVLDHFRSWMRAAAAQLKPQEFKRNQYDRHELLGPFGESLTDPVMNANYEKVRMLKGLSDDFQKAADDLGRKWQDSLREGMENKVLIDLDKSTPEEQVPLRMTRGRMVGIAIHVGNESNFNKLVKGWGWEPADVWRFLHDNMTENDWKAAQTVWDLYDKHWPEMEAMNRRLGSTMPDKIEPRAFPTKFGEQRGGYAAIKYDPLRSRRGEKEQAMQAINPAQGLFGRDYYRPDTTSNGSMNTRIEGYNDRVDLDFHTIARTLQESIHDLAYRETLINANKVIEHPKFRSAFRSAYGPEAYHSLQDWIGQLANSNNMDRAVGALGKFLQYTRTGVVINAIAFRATTVLKHGGSAGIKTTGYFLGGGEKFLASRMASMGTDYTNQIEGAKAKFGEIATRLLQQDRDFRRTASTLFEKDTAFDKAHRFGHAAVAWSDMMTAVPTAWAAYDRAITEGIPKSQGGTGEPMTEAQAVNYANKIVREAHGSTAEAARSLVLNNSSEAMKMFTTLYGFMNNSLGQQLDGFDKLRTGGINNSPVLARSFMAIIVPALWAAYLTHGVPDKNKESWAAWIGKAIGSEVASTVPFVRDAVGIIEGFHNAGMVAAENWLATMIQAGTDVAKGNGKVKNIANAAGMGLHIPGLGQIGTSVQYVKDVHSGKEHPANAAEYAQGVITGHGPRH